MRLIDPFGVSSVGDDLYSRASSVYFDDAEHRRNAAALECNRLCSYLLTLAAVQRGLQVTMAGSTKALGRKIRGAHREAPKPRFIKISDGATSHIFDHSCGDLTSQHGAATSDNKLLTKLALAKAGVPTPPGGAYAKGQTKAAVAFLRNDPRGRFLIKPVLGSHARGVEGNLTKDQALARLREATDTPFIVENHVTGAEYRVYVVNGKVAGAWRRSGAYVTGDGRRTVADLISARNANRAANPQMRTQIIDLAKADAFLAQTGKRLSFVPVFGQRLPISDSLNSRVGGMDIDVFGKLPDHIARVAIRACAALGLPNGGADIIDQDGTGFVLEVNSKANIGKHSFPETGRGSGNTVAEALLDLYFPNSISTSPDVSRLPDVAKINAAFRENGLNTNLEAPIRFIQASDSAPAA